MKRVSIEVRTGRETLLLQEQGGNNKMTKLCLSRRGQEAATSLVDRRGLGYEIQAADLDRNVALEHS